MSIGGWTCGSPLCRPGRSGPFWGDYWIIDLDPEFRYAVVGHPNRKYLWILSRTRTMDASIYSGILERLTERDMMSAGFRSRSNQRNPPVPDRGRRGELPT